MLSFSAFPICIVLVNIVIILTVLPVFNVVNVYMSDLFFKFNFENNY